jgi:hypothetical protein
MNKRTLNYKLQSKRERKANPATTVVPLIKTYATVMVSTVSIPSILQVYPPKITQQLNLAVSTKLNDKKNRSKLPSPKLAQIKPISKNK